jgi:hypothetical protein
MNKKWNITYYIATILLSASMLLGAYFELTGAPSAVSIFEHLGYPVYLLYILGVAKILGVVGIWQGEWPVLREWAYAGLSIDLVGALASHLFVGDGPTVYGSAFLHLVVLIVSYVALKRRAGVVA